MPPPGAGRARGRKAGGFTFAEHPAVAAPDARILWHADLDPTILRVTAQPVAGESPDHVARSMLERWLTLIPDIDGTEHIVLSDGRRRIRLDIEAGSIADGGPVLLHYRLEGIASAERRVRPLRRFLHLCQRRRFSRSLFPAEPGMDRHLLVLRVSDALRAGASQREIALVLFGADRVAQDNARGSDSLRSRVKRLIGDARRMAAGGYRALMQKPPV